MEAVEIGDGRGLVVDGPQVVRVEHGDESDSDAGDGQDVEHGVQELVPDAAAAPARPGKEKAIVRLVSLI